MDIPRYIVRRIDHSGIELLPDGRMLIWVAGAGAPIVLEAHVAYAVYLFMLTPGVRPALRRLDDDRQRQTWESREAARSNDDESS